jgi:hypothetical protein
MFLELPAEIRNNIYGYLCHSAAPIRLYFHQDPDSNTLNPVVPFTFYTETPVALFLTCRQLNVEASSVFYSENVFLLNRRTRFASLMKPCFVSALVKFFDVIGSRASLVRNVVFDTFNLYNSVFLRTYTEKMPGFFDPVTDIVEVTVLLHQAWDRGLNFKISLIDVADVDQDRAAYWMQNPDLVRTTRVMNIISALLDGQLELKQYRGSVRAIAVKRDGSGGLIGWTGSPHGTHSTSPSPSCFYTTTEFRAEAGGTQLVLVPHALL